MEKTFIRFAKLLKGNFKISRKLFVLELAAVFMIGFISGILTHSVINRKQRLSEYDDRKQLS